MKIKYFIYSVLSIAIILSVALLTISCNVSTSSLYSVNHNLNQSANNFECFRRITVYNARTDMLIMYLEGAFAVTNNSYSELVVTCKTGENTYKKNYVYLNDYTIYVIEDITDTITDPYHYKLHIYTSQPDFDINE